MKKIDLPIWLSDKKDRILVVDKYEQDLLKGFLITNMNKSDFQSLEMPEPLVTDNESSIYIYETSKYDDFIKKSFKVLEGLENSEELINDLKGKYNPHLMLFSKDSSPEQKRKRPGLK